MDAELRHDHSLSPERAASARPLASTTPEIGDAPQRGASPAQPVGQIVLVLQGGGALGAYQAGVYHGLRDGGIEPDWVIGTSIGAINGALIAGNPTEQRLDRLQTFWGRIGHGRGFDNAWSMGLFANALANLNTLTHGVPGFFQSNPHAPWGMHFPVGLERASFYTTEPLRRTLGELVYGEALRRGNSAGERDHASSVAAPPADGRYFIRSATICATSVGVVPTAIPRASSASFFPCAVPDEPEMIAPAWPIVFPDGAEKPAMYASTGFVTCSAT